LSRHFHIATNAEIEELLLVLLRKTNTGEMVIGKMISKKLQKRLAIDQHVAP